MQKSTGSDLIPEEQIQAIVSKVESNTEILKGVYLLQAHQELSAEILICIIWRGVAKCFQ